MDHSIGSPADTEEKIGIKMLANSNCNDEIQIEDCQGTAADDWTLKMGLDATAGAGNRMKLQETTLKMDSLDLERNSHADTVNMDEESPEAEAMNEPIIQETEASDHEEKTKKKKKKSNKKQHKPAKPKPTGFEDYYVDPPIAPAEHLEEQALYSPDKAFAERFLLAVARYTSRRKFNEFRLKVFDKYLAYGGLSTGIKQFQGRVDENGPDMTATDIAMEKSKYHLEDETLDDSVVDFNAVACGFLGSYLYSVQELLQLEDIQTATSVIQNFLNYLLYHNVCPEYAEQIYDAKQSCDDADRLLPICSKLASDLPGTFNEACSLLFGGYFRDTHIEEIQQAKFLNLEPGMRMEDAAKIFLAGLAAHGSHEVIEAYNIQAKDEAIHITNRQSLYLEVISTHPPSAEITELYSMAQQSSISPIGSIKFQTWQHPHGPWPEMTPAEVRALKTAPYPRQQYEMYMDAGLLSLMLVGTKVCCTCYETSFGLRYFDSIIGVLSPMYTWLNNEAVMDWIKPRELLWKAKSAHADDEMDVIAETTVDGRNRQLTNGKVMGTYDDNEDIPDELKKYEKGEDIVVTI